MPNMPYIAWNDYIEDMNQDTKKNEKTKKSGDSGKRGIGGM